MRDRSERLGPSAVEMTEETPGHATIPGRGVAPALACAGLPRRAVAAVVDVIVLLALGWPVAVATGSTTGVGYQLSGSPVLLVFAVWLAYYVGAEAAWGSTVGKRLLGIRVVDENGCRVDLGAALVRNVVRVVDFLFFYLIGFLVAAASPRRQRLGDQLAGTVVVRAGRARRQRR